MDWADLAVGFPGLSAELGWLMIFPPRKIAEKKSASSLLSGPDGVNKPPGFPHPARLKLPPMFALWAAQPGRFSQISTGRFFKIHIIFLGCFINWRLYIVLFIVSPMFFCFYNLWDLLVILLCVFHLYS